MNDTVKCLQCDTDISTKRAGAKFCSGACKLKFNRKQEPEIILPITKTTIKYREAPGSPEWYRHGTPDDPKKTWNKICVRCGITFTTNLSLMRYCSAECKSEVMVVIANGPHKNYDQR